MNQKGHVEINHKTLRNVACIYMVKQWRYWESTMLKKKNILVKKVRRT